MKYGTLVRIPETENISAACEEKFSRLQEMGMDACQLVYKPKTYTLEAADIIRECALRHGVEISAQFCGFYDSLGIWDAYFDYRVAGIRNDGRSRIRYHRDRFSFLHNRNQFLRCRTCVEFMTSHQRLFYLIMIEKFESVTGIFTENNIRAL